MVVLKHPNYEKNNIGKANHLHFARLALWEFQRIHNRLPELHSDADADEMYTIANGLKEKQQALEDGLKVVDAVPDDTAEGKIRYVADQLCREDVRRYALYARAGNFLIFQKNSFHRYRTFFLIDISSSWIHCFPWWSHCPRSY